jgi:hypothetical protein
MKITVFKKATGEIVRRCIVPVGAADIQINKEIEDWIDGDYCDGAYYVKDFKAIPIPEAPSSHHTFDYAVKQWVDRRTLTMVKEAKRRAITDRRVNEDRRFEWRGKWFQANEAAWKQITAVHGWVTARAELPPGFLGQWKAEDNTYTPINDVQAWWSFYDAAIARGMANFTHSEERKKALDACTTVAEVDFFEIW